MSSYSWLTFESNRPFHKILCTTFENFKDDKRPSDNHVRAILFPADGSKIKHLWLNQHRGTDGMFYPYLKPHLEDIDASTLQFDDLHVPENLHMEVGHGLMVIGRRLSVPSPHLPINKSIMALGKVGHMKTRTGNHIIVARKLIPVPKNKGHQTTVLADVNFRDFRHALDFYQLDPANLCVVNPERFTQPTMPGLIVHCNGNMQRLFTLGLTSQLEQVLIPRDRLHESIESGRCESLFRMGLKWYYRKLPLLCDWDKTALKENINLLRNPEARHLVSHIADREEQRLEPDLLTGTIVVFERRGAPLQPAHLTFTNNFIDSIARKGIYRGWDKVTGSGVWLVDNKSIAHFMKELEEFWANMKKDSKARGVDLDRLPCPYELQGTLSPPYELEGTLNSNDFTEAMRSVTGI